MTPNRADAWHLLNDYTKSESLLKHALAVEAAVRGYARTFGEDETAWGIVALLHDFDYERWPSLEEHPYRGSEILRGQGYPEWVVRAILSHADYTGVPREGRLEKTLFACDEMAGFVTAASLVRPSAGGACEREGASKASGGGSPRAKEIGARGWGPAHKVKMRTHRSPHPYISTACPISIRS